MIGDCQQTPIKALELTPGFLIIQQAASVHLQEVACSSQCLADSREVGAEGLLEGGKRGQRMALCRILADLVELSLQVLVSDLDIAQGHTDVFVSEQLHQSGKADAQTEHLSGIAVA